MVLNLNNVNVLVVDDNMFKLNDVKEALRTNGIQKENIKTARNLEEVWKMLDLIESQGKTVDLLVTDMNYPLQAGERSNGEAGFILIEQLKKKNMDIPVIICSTRNFSETSVLGTVWYSELRNLDVEFRRVLKKLEE